MPRDPAPPDESGEEPPPGYERPTPPDDLPTHDPERSPTPGGPTKPVETGDRVDRVPDQLDASDVEHRFASLADKTRELPEDEWDGMCDLDFEMAPSTSDDEIDALVLFADTQFDDPDAVAARRAEWNDLFDRTG